MNFYNIFSKVLCVVMMTCKRLLVGGCQVFISVNNLTTFV